MLASNSSYINLRSWTQDWLKFSTASVGHAIQKFVLIFSRQLKRRAGQVFLQLPWIFWRQFQITLRRIDGFVFDIINKFLVTLVSQFINLKCIKLERNNSSDKSAFHCCILIKKIPRNLFLNFCEHYVETLYCKISLKYLIEIMNYAVFLKGGIS